MSALISYAPQAVASDQDDWELGADDAKAEIRAAVGYLLRGTAEGVRGDIVQAIISIVRQARSRAGHHLGGQIPLDDGMPGG